MLEELRNSAYEQKKASENETLWKMTNLIKLKEKKESVAPSKVQELMNSIKSDDE